MKVLSERRIQYGEFHTFALLCQSLKREVWGCDGWNNLSTAQAEAVEMILHKISRIVNGDPDIVDSWLDIAGYATLGMNSISGDNNERT